MHPFVGRKCLLSAILLLSAVQAFLSGLAVFAEESSAREPQPLLIEEAHEEKAGDPRADETAVVPLDWEGVVGEITKGLYDSYKFYEAGDTENAVWLVGQAYFHSFEGDGHGGMEIAVRRYISKARMLELEKLFSTVQQRMLRGEAPGTVRADIETLGDMLLADAALLAGHVSSPANFFKRPNVLQVLAASLLFAFSWLVAIALLYRCRNRMAKHEGALWSIAAGFVLGVAFLLIFPEATKLVNYRLGGICILVGLLLMLSCEFALGRFFCSDCPGCPYVCRKLVVFIALLHSVMEGSLIGIGFEINANVGWMTTIGLLLHEIPEGLALLMVLFNSKDAKKIAVQLIAITALVPLSAVATAWAYPSFSPGAVGVWLMFGVAFFIYFPVRGVFPQLAEKKIKGDFAWLFVGVAIIAGAQWLLGF